MDIDTKNTRVLKNPTSPEAIIRWSEQARQMGLSFLPPLNGRMTKTLYAHRYEFLLVEESDERKVARQKAAMERKELFAEPAAMGQQGWALRAIRKA